MTRTGSRQYLPRKMALLLTSGFAILIGLMVVLTYTAVSHMQSQDDRMRDIVELRNRKIHLATNLLQATHNRHNSLVYQIMVDDPFERDEHFQSYIRWGYEVGKARNELRAMPLDAFETENLGHQDQLVQEIVTIQESISDLAKRDRTEEARTMIAITLRPYNLRFIGMVEDLQAHERARTQESLVEARQATRNAVFIDLLLGVVLTLLAAVIAVFTSRQLNKYAKTIQEQMEALAQTGIRLQHEATHDPLTGLANRALFHRRLDEALQHADEEEFLLAVMYLDLDDFKQVNDVHGHAVGDALLREVAHRLRQVVRASDTVARLGGDEFAIILLGLDSMEQCGGLARKIEQELVKPATLAGVPVQPGGSIGYVLFPRDGKTVDQLLVAADQRMYEVKRAHKERRNGQA